MLPKLVWLAVGGAMGTLARYGLAGFVHRMHGVSFPWGTMAVNLVGSFMAGMLWALFENRWTVSSEIRTIVFVGFMGAFTTFSSMILESSELYRSATWLHAAANLTLQNGLGLIALFAGQALGRLA